MLKISKIYAINSRLAATKGARSISTTIEAGEYDSIANRKRYKYVYKDPLLTQHADEFANDTKFYDTTVSISARLASMKMNRNHKFNIFTEGFIGELERTLHGLETLGDDVHLIRFGATEKENYSRGTDMKRIHYLSETKDMDPLVQYLNKLFNWHVSFVSCNKPLLGTAHGHIENSAIGLVGGAGISCITPDAHLLFNETSKRNKMVPHAGASYYLSRMPGELGTFLALTGTPFTGSEAQAILGLADYILEPTEHTFQDLRTRLRLLDRPVTAEEIYTTDGIMENTYKYKYELERNKKLEQDINNYDQRVLDANIVPDDHERKELQYQLNNEKLSIEYRQKLREELEHKILHETTKLGSGATGHYINHYDHYAKHIKDFLEFGDPDLTNSILRRYENEINRCFFEDSVEKIIERLKLENSKFGNYCIERIENNDRTALNVTLELLRQAAKTSYSECMRLELKSMINLAKNEHNVTDQTPMTPELVKEYFKEPAEYKYVDLKAPKHAALPTRHYYEKYADHMRLLMNEHNSFQTKIRDGYQREVQSELREQGIDIRESGLTTQIIRTSLWNKEYHDLAKKHKEKLQSYFLNDEKFSERYYAEVAEQIEALSLDSKPWDDTHKDYYSLVNDLIRKCYEDAFMKNIEMMLEKNKQIHQVKKKEFFMNLKKFFFETRLLEPETHRLMVDTLRMKHMPELQQLTLGDELPQTLEEFEEMFRPNIYGDQLYAEQKIARVHHRRAERIGYDPFKESKYWEEYLKYKAIKEQHFAEFEKRQNNRKLTNQKLKVAQAKDSDRLDQITKENEQEFLDEILKDELEFKPESKMTDVKNLNDLTEYCIKEHPTLGFLAKGANTWEQTEPKSVSEFKEKFRSILNKFLQIGILTSANSDLSKGELNFMKAVKTSKMDVIDSFLTEKVNLQTLHKMMENVIPAVNIAMKGVIEDEAKTILYLLKYKENATKILLQLIGMEENPNLIQSQLYVEMFKDEFKNDPDVMELLKHRPKNLFYKKARESETAISKLSDRFSLLLDEDPINALQALCESV